MVQDVRKLKESSVLLTVRYHCLGTAKEQARFEAQGEGVLEQSR